jgi:hypothetical protein
MEHIPCSNDSITRNNYSFLKSEKEKTIAKDDVDFLTRAKAMDGHV